MRQVIDDFERILREHPKIWPDGITVRFVSFGDSSLNIDVMAWFQTADWNEFPTDSPEHNLLQFMEIVEKAGSSFAFQLARPRGVAYAMSCSRSADAHRNLRRQSPGAVSSRVFGAGAGWQRRFIRCVRSSRTCFSTIPQIPPSPSEPTVEKQVLEERTQRMIDVAIQHQPQIHEKKQRRRLRRKLRWASALS